MTRLFITVSMNTSLFDWRITMLHKTKVQRTVILVVGALLSYLAASGRFLSAPEAIAAPSNGQAGDSADGRTDTLLIEQP
jgi:hypothetical protein